MRLSHTSQLRRWTLVWLIAIAALAGLAVSASAQPVPAVTEYYHLDALGSTRVVTSETGAVLRHYDFGPFGGQDSPCTQSPDKRLFTGQVRDRETCLDYFGARHMRSTFGRFLTVDPVLDTQAALVDPQQWNRYAYARNNPMKFVDPDGKNPVLVVVGLGWALYEVGSAAYDVYNAVTTVADPTATAVEKSVAVVGAAVSVFGPGGGYGTLGRAGANAVEALPELRISASQFPELAQNVANALKAGHPSILTHGADRVVNRADALRGVPNVKPLSRDEYPFASTRQGGIGAWVGHISKQEQDRQGALIVNFLAKYGIKPGDRYRVVIVE